MTHQLTYVRLLLGVALVGVPLLLLSQKPAPGQRYFQGLLEGVHPARLQIDARSPAATLTYANAQTVEFVGGCNDGECAYRAIDTALALHFVIEGVSLRGTQRNGLGLEQRLAFSEVAPDLPMIAACDDGKWLRRYTDRDYTLVVASLAEGNLLGTLHLHGPATSLSVSGTIDESGGAQLTARRYDGTPAGTLTVNASSLADDANSLAGALVLRGTTTTLTLGLATRLAMGCYQADNRFDLIYPLAPTTRGSDQIVNRVNDIWEALPELGAPASGWFEPTRADADLISGWLHLTGQRGARSYAVNINPRTGRTIKANVLVGARRSRNAIRSQARERAIARHPLRDVEGFAAWIEAQDFAGCAVVEEGIAYASDRHPVFGQLRYVEPWSTYATKREVPDWLDRTQNGRR